MMVNKSAVAKSNEDLAIQILSEFLGVGWLPVMDELDPLEKRSLLENFQVAFMTVPVNICPC